MAVDAEMLKRIMGAPDSPTGKIVAMRKTPGDGELETGVWYSNFSRVKAEAERRNIPFFAMWTNGDLCGFCRRFTSNLLEPYFLERMKTSDSLFWLGGSMDDNEEDRRGGVGFKWCLGPDHNVTYFPFFAVMRSSEQLVDVSFFGSGHDYDKRLTGEAGAEAICEKISSILRGEAKNASAQNQTAEKPATPVQKTAVSPVAASVPVTPVDRVKRPDASPVRTNTSLHIRFNQEWDADHIARFMKALKDNDGHCCCQKDKTSDTMCMCKTFLEKGEPGKCHCGAFEKFAV